MSEISGIVHSNGANGLNIIAIGTSTGGPKALQDLIPTIPSDIPAAVLVVQHMPALFTKSLADRLDSRSNLKVKEAVDGETIKQGFVYIAPGGQNMLVKNFDNSNGLKLQMSSDSMQEHHKPSVNILLNSLAESNAKKVICVIMTGMGSDGSKGVINLKEKKKSYVIAQSEQSSVVFGMPKAAIKTGMVDIVLPLNEIVSHINNILGVNK